MAQEVASVLANDEDAFEDHDGTDFDSTHDQIRVKGGTAPNRRDGGFLFVIPNIASGDTITDAFLTVEVEGNDVADCTIYCEDVDNAVDFTANADVASRVRTTANVAWVDASTGVGTGILSPSFVGPVQEVIDRGGWSAGNGLMPILEGNDLGATTRLYMVAFDHATGVEAEITIDYTAAAAVTSDMWYQPAQQPYLVTPDVVSY